jgi:hypothetical protein
MLRGSASKKTVVASERDRPDIARRRAQWMSRQRQIDPERLVFIDETWTKTNMAPLRGWAPHGQRLVAKVPNGHWKTTTLTGLPQQGSTLPGIQAIACAPALQQARPVQAFQRLRSGSTPGRLRTPCFRATSGMASCFSGTPSGFFSRPLN